MSESEPTYTASEVDTAICLFDAFDSMTAAGTPGTHAAAVSWREANGTAAMRAFCTDLVRDTERLWDALHEGYVYDDGCFDFDFCPRVIEFALEHDRVPTEVEFRRRFLRYEVAWRFAADREPGAYYAAASSLRQYTTGSGARIVYEARDTRTGCVIRSR